MFFCLDLMISVSFLNFGQFLDLGGLLCSGSFDFGSSALILVMSLVATLRKRHYCFVNFSFCLFYRDFYESQWVLFSLKVSRSGVEIMFVVLIQFFFHIRCNSRQYQECYSRRRRLGLFFG